MKWYPAVSQGMKADTLYSEKTLSSKWQEGALIDLESTAFVTSFYPCNAQAKHNYNPLNP